jgi:hypothetical protein
VVREEDRAVRRFLLFVARSQAALHVLGRQERQAGLLPGKEIRLSLEDKLALIVRYSAKNSCRVLIDYVGEFSVQCAGEIDGRGPTLEAAADDVMKQIGTEFESRVTQLRSDLKEAEALAATFREKKERI